MTYFTSEINILQILGIAIGVGFAVLKFIDFMQEYGNDNFKSKSQLMTGGVVVLIITQLISLLTNLF